MIGLTILDIYGEDHNRLKGIMAPEMMQVLRNEQLKKKIILDTVNEVIFNIKKNKSIDLIVDIAEKIPIRVICNILKITNKNIDEIYNLSRKIIYYINGGFYEISFTN